jgi:GTPase KRas protein
MVLFDASTLEARELAKDFGCRYVETSAKARHNVEEVFHGIVREIRKVRKEQRKADKKDKTGSCTIL